LAYNFSSCIGLYTPNRPPTPILERGWVNLSAGGHGSSFEAQGAYGITDHIGVLASYDNQQPSGDPLADFSGKFFDLGVGYFDYYRSHWHFEGWAALGWGSANGRIAKGGPVGFEGSPVIHSMEGEYDLPATNKVREIDAKYFRESIQAHWGLEGNVGGLGIGGRVSTLELYRWHQIDRPDSGAGSTTEITGSLSGLLFEPYVFLHLGTKWVKLYTELWVSYPLNRFHESYSPVNLAGGVILEF
jgi:hypothetical protein